MVRRYAKTSLTNAEMKELQTMADVDGKTVSSYLHSLFVQAKERGQQDDILTSLKNILLQQAKSDRGPTIDSQATLETLFIVRELASSANPQILHRIRGQLNATKKETPDEK